jgi:hypothetical protein
MNLVELEYRGKFIQVRPDRLDPSVSCGQKRTDGGDDQTDPQNESASGPSADSEKRQRLDERSGGHQHGDQTGIDQTNARHAHILA